MKKILALILTGVMVTSVSVMAFAENAEPETPVVDEITETSDETSVDDPESGEGTGEEGGDSTNPENPDDSANPENPGDSTNPENPGDSTNPENPDDSTNPENPGDSTNPENPDDSANPENPGDSTNPENPDDSANPEKPGDSTNPENPDDSANPENPDDSTNPENPDDSANPEAPDDSTNPENPDDSTNPENPDDSTNPTNPDDSNIGSGEEGDSGSGSTVTDNPNATCKCWYPDNCPSYAEFGYCCGAPDCPCGDNLASSNSNGEEQYDRGSEAEALAIEATGVSTTTFVGAAAENKSIGEYMNNAVTAAPGLDNAIPVSQGGNVIINGVPSNHSFYVLKALSGHTDSAKAHAASLGGKVLNVARIDAGVSFTTATVNFYMPGIKAGQNIQVYQYDYVKGQWMSVAVAEVRNDHVVVDMTSLGVLAFIEVP